MPGPFSSAVRLCEPGSSLQTQGSRRTDSKDGDVDLVRLLIQGRASLNGDRCNKTPLQLASGLACIGCWFGSYRALEGCFWVPLEAFNKGLVSPSTMRVVSSCLSLFTFESLML